MESKNRNTWIIVIGVLLIACCCIVALTAGAVAWLADRYTGSWEAPLDMGSLQRERVEERFEVGAAPDLEITNFAGAITIRTGEEGTISVVATKRASSRSRLDRIDVDMRASGSGVTITTRRLFDGGNAYVELEIVVPANSSVSVDTGAGEVDLRGVAGSIDIHSGAGQVDVRDASGRVQVDLGAGQILYEGTPQGDCRFQTGVGEVVLQLPENPNVRVDLGTGIGAVDVEFDVDGSVSTRSVKGVIGDGRQGSIFAHTGAGAVRLESQ
ncbi:MAG: hypothetical protein ACK2UC_04860 [Anaerolineae bacterium]|jgi:hypothetical protein